MQKRLVAQGNATLTLSLPSKWIKENNLVKGDEVNLNVEGKDIVISTENKDGLEKLTLDTKTQSFEKQYLHTFYHLGFDEVEILYQDQKVVDLIKKHIGGCIGFEIVDQTMDKIVIKNLSAGPMESEFNTILRKIFLVTKDIGLQLEEFVQNKNYDKIKSVASMEDNNVKFISFCLRVLNKHGYKDSQKKTNIYYVIIENLEMIGDEYKYLANFIADNKKKIVIDKDLNQVLKQTNEFFQEFYDIFYKFEKDKQIDIIKMRNELYDKANELFLKQDVYGAKFLHHLINIINFTRETVNIYYEARF